MSGKVLVPGPAAQRDHPVESGDREHDDLRPVEPVEACPDVRFTGAAGCGNGTSRAANITPRLYTTRIFPEGYRNASRALRTRSRCGGPAVAQPVRDGRAADMFGDQALGELRVLGFHGGADPFVLLPGITGAAR